MSAVALNNLRYGVQQHFWTPKKTILDGVTLQVEPGEIYGFLGPNGAGKTTTIKALLGLLAVDSGTAHIFGGDPRKPQVRRQVGFMPERAYFPEYLSARELVLQHALLAGLAWRAAHRRTQQVIAEVGLDHAAREPLRGYSKGMLQRVGLAQALVGEPRLVVLDEPMSGLDPIGRRDIREIMLRLKQAGCTVFFSTHILPDVEALCDRVAILVGGRVRRVETLATVLSGTTAAVEVHAEGVSPETGKKAGALPTIAQRQQGEVCLFEAESQAAANELLDLLRQGGATIVAVSTRRHSLEEVFVREAASKGTP